MSLVLILYIQLKSEFTYYAAGMCLQNENQEGNW